MSEMDGMLLKEMASLQARTHAFVALWPCWSEPKPVSMKSTASIPSGALDTTKSSSSLVDDRRKVGRRGAACLFREKPWSV